MAYRRWCFTSYDVENPPTGEIPGLTYLIYQLEKCPDTGRHHYQGYIHLSKTIRISGLHKIAGLGSAHFEPAHGSPEDNRKYCSKSESQLAGPWEIGTCPKGQGARSDLNAVKSMIDDGATDKDLADAHFEAFLKYGNAFNRYRMLSITPRDFRTDLHLVLGKTGLGKSAYVRFKVSEDLEEPGLYSKTASTAKYFDGMQIGNHLLLDDFYGWIPFTELLRLADEGPYQVEIKGSFVPFVAPKIWITSNSLPRNWYNGNTISDAMMDSLYRRVTNVTYFYEFGRCRTYEGWLDFYRSDFHNDLLSHIVNS